MRERARLVGGSVHAAVLPGGGFEVAARLPLERAS
jgi:signal transduction histidine kinase